METLGFIFIGYCCKKSIYLYIYIKFKQKLNYFMYFFCLYILLHFLKVKMNMSYMSGLPKTKKQRLLPISEEKKEEEAQKPSISSSIPSSDDEISIQELCILLRCDPQQVINVSNHWNISYWDAIEMIYNVNVRNPNTDWNTLREKKVTN